MRRVPKAYGELDPVLQQHGHRADGLIEVLNAAQSCYGWLSDALLRHIARRLHLPFSRVQGTASFYHLFRFEAARAQRCLVCTGTACHVQGGSQLLAELQQQLAHNNNVELGSVRCVGTCSGAPLVVVNDEVWNHQSTNTVLAGLKALEKDVP
jgi:bidirectional [NiFe] hydrogenase diaphorase subunit